MDEEIDTAQQSSYRPQLTSMTPSRSKTNRVQLFTSLKTPSQPTDVRKKIMRKRKETPDSDKTSIYMDDDHDEDITTDIGRPNDEDEDNVDEENQEEQFDPTDFVLDLHSEKQGCKLIVYRITRVFDIKVILFFCLLFSFHSFSTSSTTSISNSC